MSRITTGLLIVILGALASPEALALITGGEGNRPITDPGWPAGAAALFNHPGRVDWWEGPPFGGNQWHSECRGDIKALGAVWSGPCGSVEPFRLRGTSIHDLARQRGVPGPSEIGIGRTEQRCVRWGIGGLPVDGPRHAPRQ